MRSMQAIELLTYYETHQAKADWVFAIITKVNGHSYRKAGAFMLINGLGQQVGLLSGGCLEGDLVRKAQRVLQNNQMIEVTYDFTEDSEEAWQMGLGCGGEVTIRLAYIDKVLSGCLLHILTQLRQGQPVNVCVNMEEGDNQEMMLNLNIDENQQYKKSISTCIKPPPQIAVFGSGIDVLPVVNLANLMGWQVSVIDENINTSKRERFLAAEQCLSLSHENLKDWLKTQTVTAAVVMTHNVLRDAQYLQALQHYTLSYIGLLGPISRRQRVLEKISLTTTDIPQLASPIGLDIGGELPEAIALSIIAEIQAHIEGKLKK
ncbi:MAG: XdhC family protein [Pseudomonadota bacterium]